MPPTLVREPAIARHRTATDKSSSWTGPGEVAKASGAAQLRYMHAIFRGGDREVKGNYAVPHHKAGTDTAAVIAGVNNGLARLSQVSGVSDAERRGAETHLRGHRRDAGLEESMTGAEMRAAVEAVVEADELDEAEADRLLGAVVRREIEIRETQIVTSDAIPLAEQAVGDAGTALVKLIAPGWGSSGFYGAEMLKRDGPRVFHEGLHMYWDHPTTTEERERPEGSLTTLAGALTENARWAESPAGPGLYARVKVFEGFRPTLAEIAPHIGVSIRAFGRFEQGDAEGRTGPIVTELTAAASVDYVTLAGAGGQVVSMFEEAKRKGGDVEDDDTATLEEARRRLQEARTAGDWLEARLHMAFTEIADFLFGQGFVTREERKVLSRGMTAGLDAFRSVIDEQAPELVARDPFRGPDDNVTAQESKPTKEEETMSEKDTNTEAVREAEEAKATAERERDEARRDNERLRETELNRKARDHVRDLFAFDTKLTSERARRRVEEAAVAQIPTTDEGRKLDTAKLDEAVDAAYREEVEYLAEISGSGKVHGMGGDTDPLTETQSDEERQKVIDERAELLERSGLSKEAAKFAASR